MLKFIRKLNSIFVPQEANGYEPPALRQRTLLAYGLGILILKIIVIAFIIYFPRTDFFAAINSQNLVNLINQARTSQNLSPLAVNKKLNEAANLKAQDMITNNYFEHTSPAGISPWHWFSQAGYSYVWAGENLALHFTDTNAVYDAWMASAGHRDNILSPNFKEIGVAVAEGQIGGWQTTVAVLEFGSPASVQPKNVAQAKTDSSNQAQSKTETKNREQNNAPIAENNSVGQENVNLTQAPLAELSLPVKVLGTFTINFVELAKDLYLYFSLFLIIALAINIMVKIRIQHMTTIVLTMILIGVSVGLIFI